MDLRQRHRRNGYWLFLGLTALALLLPIPLLNAQSASPGAGKPPPAPVARMDPQPPEFEKVDRNHDGLIDKSESGAVQGMSANFERLDRNRDGKLDREEFSRGLTFLLGKK